MSGRTTTRKRPIVAIDRTCLTQNGKFTALTVGFSRRNQKTFRRRFKHTSGHLRLQHVSMTTGPGKATRRSTSRNTRGRRK